VTRLLSGKLALHDCEDVEALAQSVISRAALDLRPHQHEDLLAFLLGECWRLSLKYEQGKGSTTSFVGWATTNLRLRSSTGYAPNSGGRATSSATAYTNGSSLVSSHSRTTATEVDWSMLSPRGQAILRTIGIPRSEGYSLREIARQLGTTSFWVSARLVELRSEIERLSSYTRSAPHRFSK
jgi:hypothetical protein